MSNIIRTFDYIKKENIMAKLDREYYKKIKVGETEMITVWDDAPSLEMREAFKQQVKTFLEKNFFFEVEELDRLFKRGHVSNNEHPFTLENVSNFFLHMTSMHDIKQRVWNEYEVIVWFARCFKELRTRLYE